MPDKLDYLIKILCEERGENVPALGSCDKRALFRALVNVRMPKEANREFLQVQDKYLREELRRKGITDIADLTPLAPDLYLWQGDITTLKCDGIVNAANSQMLGCFCPNHSCIDNAIHTFAGVQLRQECAEIMKAQGAEEATGQAKITKAYNLPCKYILHTVGPVVYGELTQAHEKQLANCYRSCLTLADKNKLQSIAFCCISTGEFTSRTRGRRKSPLRRLLNTNGKRVAKSKLFLTCLRSTIMQFTQKYSEQINKLKAALDSADAVLIGAGAGLSTSAGFTYGGERFLKYFADFHESTELPICIRAASTPLKLRKNIGLGGRDTSSITATLNRPSLFITIFTNL